MTTPRAPRNTARAMQDDAERLLFLAEGMGRGPGAFIEAQEAAGQREIVTSTVIPTRILRGTEEQLTDLGFLLGDVVEGDDLFRQATLPDGWKREGTDHAMWSHIVDGLGRRRCSIFYKAAFYDRDAHISVSSVSGYVTECLYEDRVPVLDGQWATRDAVIDALQKIGQHESEQAEKWATWGDTKYEREAKDKVAQCEAMRARVEAAEVQAS